MPQLLACTRRLKRKELRNYEWLCMRPKGAQNSKGDKDETRPHKSSLTPPQPPPYHSVQHYHLYSSLIPSSALHSSPALPRSGSGDRVWSPTLSDDGKTSPYTEPDSQQNFRPITSGYGGYGRKPSHTPEPQPTPVFQPTHLNNGHARPNNGHTYGYGNGTGTGHAQYNNPAGLYAQNGSNGDRSLPNKMGGLSLTHSPEPPVHSPVGRNDTGNNFNTESDVYKMLQHYEEPISQPKQSGSFKYLQGILEAGDGGVSPTERMRSLRSPVRSPIPKLGSPIPGPGTGLQKLPQCTRCGNGIVGTIVKARDKLYHPECFMCDDCGINLKQRGYFFIEDNLYCETHAKARVQPPEGYDVVAVYPNSKVELV
ncbi:PDZ and LIM domain protein 4-like [Lampris incognitus]|uniref:PDZ and LIM domain protein 4-like n=1 Tax=Lampris incognitus TaxID=2546036 RepID=UPI0024B607A2|nr:PDZ and LIM domain protein 4-like [Lampris incognitus]